MKLKLHLFLTAIFLAICSSCSKEDVMLYHPEPIRYWLLEHVDYPDTKAGLVNRTDVTLSYSNDDQIETIDNLNADYIMINYSSDLIEYAKSNDYGTYIYYDSLLIKVNSNKQATSALHLTYREADNEKVRTQNDSTSFIYNADGYLIRMERFNRSGDEVPTYWENYSFVNGNLSEIISSAGYKHVYSYTDQEYEPVSSYCYEMPFNTISISNWGGCWLLTNCRFLSDYLGKKSANNVASVVIFKDVKEGSTPTEYASITYDFLYDEKDLVSSVEIKGMVEEIEIPTNFVTNFSYLERKIHVSEE